MEEAIRFYESSVGRIDGPAVLGDEEGEIKTKISSRATKSREDAIHFSDSEDKLDKIFDQGKIIKTEEGITLTIEDEKQELELSNKSLVLSCIRLDKSKEVFNSLDELYGVRIAPEFNFGEFNSHISSFLLHEKIKSLEPGQLSTTTETGVEFGLDFLHKFNLNDNLYLNLINTMNGYGIYNLNDKNISAFSLDDSYSINLGYIMPNKLSEFHLGIKQHLVGSIGNIQTGGFDKDGVRPHIKLSELNIGGKVLVNKKVSVDVDLSLQKGDICSGFEVAGKINKNNLGLGIQFSNKQSKELLFLPHTQEGNLIISNRGQLLGKEFIVTVAGGVQNKNYKKSKDTQYNFKAGISMLF